MKKRKGISFIFMIYVVSMFMLGCGEETSNDVDIYNGNSEEGGNLQEEDAQKIDNITQAPVAEQVNAKEYALKHNNYIYYSGVWTTNGDNSKDVYTKVGGAILELEMKGTQIRGSYTCVASKFNRIVVIENIKADIKDGGAQYTFEDDGWGNSGKLHIYFDDDRIQVEVAELVIEKYNTTGMCATGGILYKENVDVERK